MPNTLKTMTYQVGPPAKLTAEFTFESAFGFQMLTNPYRTRDYFSVDKDKTQVFFTQSTGVDFSKFLEQVNAFFNREAVRKMPNGGLVTKDALVEHLKDGKNNVELKFDGDKIIATVQQAQAESKSPEAKKIDSDTIKRFQDAVIAQQRALVYGDNPDPDLNQLSLMRYVTDEGARKKIIATCGYAIQTISPDLKGTDVEITLTPKRGRLNAMGEIDKSELITIKIPLPKFQEIADKEKQPTLNPDSISAEPKNKM